MATHTITAFFDSRADADKAIATLKQSGIADADVTLLPPTDQAGTYTDTAEMKGKGFWGSLEELFGGTDDHATYAEGLRRGGTMVSVRANDVNIDRTIEILEQHGSVDLDERETTWRGEGWTAEPARLTTENPSTFATTSTLGAGALASGALGTAAAAPIAFEDRRDVTLSPNVVEPGLISRPLDAVAETKTTTVASAASLAGGLRKAADDVIQVIEERLDVGKRAVSGGKVRIKSSIVEKPVSENVTLHGETLTVDRHAVDRPLAAGEFALDPFRERTIEMEEFNEEAVVSKTAHVVEEIGIRKDSADRVETVRDTVRSTKVDIEDGRTVASSGLMASGYATQIRDDMDVVGSDGRHVGTVDHLDGTKIKLKKNDTASGGQHHFLPVDWIQSVDGKVTLQIPAAEAMDRWSDAA